MSNQQQARTKLVPLCGLWAGEDSKGNFFLSGRFTYGTRIRIFQNGFKRTETDPDYIAYISEQDKEDQGGDSNDQSG